MSSAERSIRYGELKKLKRLRYELKNEMKSTQRKRLKYTCYDEDDNEEENGGKSDIRDVEFRISNDYDALQVSFVLSYLKHYVLIIIFFQKLLNETSLSSHKDLTLLKLVLCGGLYPQIAVGDEYNYCKVRIT